MLSPLKFVVRLLLIATLVLGSAHAVQRNVVEWLLPVCQATMEALQFDFNVLAVKIDDSETNEVVRLRVNLAHSMFIAGRTLPAMEGWMEVTLTVGSVLSFGLLTLIVVLVWPASFKEMLLRLLIALPLIIVLVVLNVISTWIAELWSPIYQLIEPRGVAASMQWSRFLMGGGGYVLGFLSGIVSISLAAWMFSPKRVVETRYASFVVPTTNSPPLSHRSSFVSTTRCS